MRKWFWCCTAAAVVAAGFFGTVEYCSTHPESSMTQAVASACKVSLQTTPFSGLHSAPAATEEGSPGAPADPVAGLDAGSELPPVVQVELPGDKFAPPPLIIREDEELKEPAVATVPATEGESIDGGVMTTEDWQAFSLAVLGNSKRMPYCDEECATICQTCCTEEAQHTFMPYAAEDCAAVCAWFGDTCGIAAGGMKCGSCGDCCAKGDAKKAEGPAEAGNKEDCCAYVSLWRRFVRAITGQDAGMGDAEESEPKEETEPMPEESLEEQHYHDHDQVCPYSGKSCSDPQYSPRPIPVEEPMGEPKKGGGEESEMKPMKLESSLIPRFFFNDPLELLQWRPAFPRIDTMEFRPSDRKLNELEQVPDWQ